MSQTLTYPDRGGEIANARLPNGATIRIYVTPIDEKFNVQALELVIEGLGVASNIISRWGNGTPEALAFPANGDALAQVTGQAKLPNGQLAQPVSMQMLAAEAWTLAAQGSLVRFFIQLLGTVAAVEGFRVTPTVTAEDVTISVRDVTAAVLKQVSRGVADSGGVGFRLLRIPN